MQHSESLKALAGALAKAQAEMPMAAENAKNPHLGNKYADLGAIIAAARPVLAKHGLSVSQFPTSEGGNVGVETILLHESGEWMSNTMFMDASAQKGLNDAQVAGLVISYLRRYAFSAVLAIYSGDDTDGNTGEKRIAATVKAGTPVTVKAVMDAKWASPEQHAQKLIEILKIGGSTMDKATPIFNIYKVWRTTAGLEPAAAAAKALSGEVYSPEQEG